MFIPFFSRCHHQRWRNRGQMEHTFVAQAHPQSSSSSPDQIPSGERLRRRAHTKHFATSKSCLLACLPPEFFFLLRSIPLNIVDAINGTC